MNTKFRAAADANGCPLSFFMTTGQVSDYTSAVVLLEDLPKAQADRASSPAFQVGDFGLSLSGMTSAGTGAIAASRSCSGASKDWRRGATRYDQCPTVFSAIALAATIIFWF